MLMVHFCTPLKTFLMFSVGREGNIGMKLVKINVSAKVKGCQMVQLQDSKNIQPSFRGTFRIHKKTFIFTKKLHYEWQDPKYELWTSIIWKYDITKLIKHHWKLWDLKIFLWHERSQHFSTLFFEKKNLDKALLVCIRLSWHDLSQAGDI